MKLRYCMECGAPLASRDATEYVCENGHEYWNEPHGSVCVAVLRDGQVLLARRGIEPLKSDRQMMVSAGVGWLAGLASGRGCGRG